ncbi:hypothetical protein D9M70_617640 [compost metagenome]
MQLERFELVAGAFGETVGQHLLVSCQNVHGKVRALGKGVCRGGILVDAPQHHRRVDRYRVETVGSQSIVLTIQATGGNDGHAGGEGAQRLAELPGFEVGSVH